MNLLQSLNGDLLHNPSLRLWLVMIIACPTLFPSSIIIILLVLRNVLSEKPYYGVLLALSYNITEKL